MLATFAGLGGALRIFCCQLRLAATSAGLGAVEQEVQGILRPDAVVWDL